MRRNFIYPYRSLRRMPLGRTLLLQSATFAAAFDIVLYALMPRVLDFHTDALRWLMDLSHVRWAAGEQITAMPGVAAQVIQTASMSYRDHSAVSVYTFAAAVLLFAAAWRWCSPPLRILLGLIPLLLGMTAAFLRWVSPVLPFTPEDFCAMWYRGEVYVWLLLPWVFSFGPGSMDLPLFKRLSWAPLLVVYSVLWSAVRLGTALATFHYFGLVWMPLFYFLFGIFADFLCTIAFYSLAMDQAANWLARRREVWQA